MIEEQGRAPYAPAKTVIDVIEGYRNRGFATPLNAEVLLRAGVPDGLVNRTIQSLKLLGLTDDDGGPTEQFEALKQARGDDEYKGRLSSWLTSAYAGVLNYADPRIDDADKVAEAFRGYEPVGQRGRMVTLMLGLFAYAGLIEESTRSMTPRPNQALLRRVAAPPRQPRKAKLQMPLPEAGSGLSELPPSVVGLLRDLPSNRIWSAARRDAWWSTFAVVLNYAYSVDNETQSNGPAMQEGQDGLAHIFK